MSPLRRLLPLLDVDWWRVARAVLLGTLAIGCSVALAATSAWLIARASQMPPVLILSMAIAGVRAFGVGRGIFRYLERLASHDVALRGMANLRASLYERLAVTGADRIAALRRGEVLSRIGSDVDEIGNLIVRAVIPAAVAALLALASVAFIATILPGAAIALLATLGLAGGLAPWLVYRAAAGNEDEIAAAHGEVSAIALAIIEDGQQLRVAGRMDAAIAELRRAEDRLAAAQDANSNRLALANALATLAQTGAVIAALVLGAAALRPGGPLDTGASGRVLLAVLAITPMAAFEAVGALPGAAIQWQRSRQAARRLAELLPEQARVAGRREDPAGPRGGSQAEGGGQCEPREVELGRLDAAGFDRRGYRELSDDETADAAALELVGVAIGWPGGPALATDVNLALRSGEALAVVGPSGIGKTTLLLTAAGQLPPLAGEVRRADQALFVAEDDHIFGTTILENLRVARGNVIEAEAKTALRDAGLGDWLAALPDGLNTMLGADATNVSGGERRRLLIARALLSPARVLLVDEPGEHLDPATADAVLAALLQHVRTSGRALVMATHRPAEAASCDSILTFE